MSIAEIEKRIIAVERHVAQIAQKLDEGRSTQDVNGWLDEIHGTFNNDATYRAAARAGKQWRKSQGANPKPARKRRSK